jgi:riboflavin synthase
MGEILRVTDGADGRRLRVRAPSLAAALRAGDSVAINGVCQTVSGPPRDGAFEVVAVAETLRRTTFGALGAGAPVHLEAALRVGDALGGHWVNGHVDARGEIREIRREGDDVAFVITLPPAIAPYVVEKGSIAVDGVSLTVGQVSAREFRVYIIPETRQRTLFGRYRVGDAVNLEADVLAKYVEKILLGRGGMSGAGGHRTDQSAAPDAARRILEEWERGAS